MDCGHCGAFNEAGRKFCRDCGQRLAVACATCGAANLPDDKFCGECGAALSSPAAPPAAARPGSRAGEAVDSTERRLVSVLFVDLVGFTTFSEGRDAEDVRAMLSRYFDIATEAVVRHGGIVEKFIGDAVMAVWGTPVAHEDDAERAVRAALEIVDRVEMLGAEIGVGLKARGGVLTGEAVAMLDATDQGLVTGDLVNTASRLQSAAEPGRVLVGERTYRSTSDAIAYEAVDPLALKGKSEVVGAWRALRVLGERRGSGRGDAPEPPFVGREEQLRLVKELLHATGREGRPRLVHVSGVAGIGKSRLVWELLKYVDGLTDDIFWHQGRCPSYGDGVSFWALAEMVRSRARILETDDEPEARGKLRSCLAEWVTDPDERQWLEPSLAHLLGLDTAPPGGRDDLFGAWRRFFECIAERGTTVLVVEELHWADSGLMDFLESLLEWSRTSPITVLSLARPELSDKRPSWGVGVRNASTVHLDALSDDEMARMLVGFVDGLPPSAVDELVRRAEGVPLYGVETVRMLVDRGVLEQQGDRYHVVGDAGDALRDLDVPETLHALVAARLDALPEAERWLVQDASVTGFSFTLQTVSAVAGREPEDVEPSLRSLVRKEVLDQDIDPRSPERGQYRFVQSVIREVAYSTLSKSARRTKHLACARRFAAFDEDELAGVVASHYLDAYRADPSAADAEEIAALAREWVSRAAERALTLGSPQQALGFSVQALELTGDARERAEIHHAAVKAGMAIAYDENVWADVQKAVQLFGSVGDVNGMADVLIDGGRTDAGDDNDALEEMLTDTIARLGDGETARRARLYAGFADRCNVVGRRERASELSEQAMVLAQSIDDDLVLREAVAARAWALGAVGREFESRLLFDAAVDLARRDGSSSTLGKVLLQAATVAFDDDPVAAIDLAVEAAEHLEKTGARWMLVTDLANLVEACVDCGRWEEADDALRRLHSLGVVERDNLAAVILGEAELAAHRGDVEAALEQLADLNLRDDDAGLLTMWTWFLRIRGFVRQLGGDPDAALADARDSLQRDPQGANARGSFWLGVQASSSLRDPFALRELLDGAVTFRGRWVQVVYRTGEAALALVEGDQLAEDGGSRAARAVRDVLDDWDDMGLPLDHAIAVLVLASASGADAVPADHAQRARDYLDTRGAVSLLRRFADAGL